jgi:nicotinate phosphoribosyltransferase
MVQLFLALGHTEEDAFQAYADVYPDDCLLLVDTVNTLGSGVPNAIRVFEKLRQKGHEPVGIRLDSGDLAYLAIQSAVMLNEAGFPDASIVLSNQLEEITILQILAQIQTEAPAYGLDPSALVDRLVYGVGTSLITSGGDAALDGVYKLVAVQEEGEWRPAIKISETPAKTPNPGHKRVWRVYDRRCQATADLLSLDDEEPETMEPLRLQHPLEHATSRSLSQSEIADVEPLLETILEDGRLVYDLPDMEAIRRRRQEDLERLDAGVKRLINPHIYHVSLTSRLWDLKQELIADFRAQKS